MKIPKKYIEGATHDAPPNIAPANKAIIGIKDSGVAQQIQKMIDGGEAIG